MDEGWHRSFIVSDRWVDGGEGGSGGAGAGGGVKLGAQNDVGLF